MKRYAWLAVVALMAIGGGFAFLRMSNHRPADDAPKVLQTLTFAGKTVHIVPAGNKPVSYETALNGDELYINGQRLDLAGASEFTVAVDADGKFELRVGAPR